MQYARLSFLAGCLLNYAPPQSYMVESDWGVLLVPDGDM